MEKVSIEKLLRSHYRWFEELASKKVDAALKRYAKRLRKEGPMPDPSRFVKKLDQLAKTRRKINRLERKIKKISPEIILYWAHTGRKTARTKLGETLFSTSFRYSVNANRLYQKITKSAWRKITMPVVDPVLLLRLAAENAEVREALLTTLSTTPSLSVIPPTSRRPKSANVKNDRKKKTKK